jgi:hypothetical protein
MFVLITSGWTGSIASGQTPAEAPVGSTASQALFEQARQFMQDGRFAEACPMLAESQRLEPAAGTLLNLALCHEREGRTATAWLEYNDALALAVRASDEDRQKIARQRIEALAPSLSKLTLLLPENVPPGLWIALDGVRLGTAASGTGVPVDPGAHVIRAGAPGKRTMTLSIDVGRAAGTTSLRLPELVDMVAAAPLASLHPVAAVARPDERPLRWLLQGAALGVGFAGLAVGTYFGLEAKSEWDTRNEHCRSGCDAQAVTAGRHAERAALMSTISMSIGLAASGLGIYMLVSGDGEDGGNEGIRVGAQFAPEHVSLTASGDL